MPVEAPLEVLGNYDCLIFLGWNTMNDEIYSRLKKYVYNGGKLFMAVPQLNINESRDKEPELIYNGDYSDLFGCRIKGKGKAVNMGIKFIEESSIPNYKYPYTKSGICDPICAAGMVTCTDIEITHGKVIAIIADKFIKWKHDSPPILIENKYGKGYASLINSFDYPGSAGLSKFMNVLLKTIISAENGLCNVKIISNDKICYAVYSLTDEQYIVYCLNTDYNVGNNAKAIYEGLQADFEVKSCEMKTILVTSQLICIPDTDKVSVRDLIESSQGTKIYFKTKDNQQIRIYSRKKPKRMYLNCSQIHFKWLSGYSIVKFTKYGKYELFVET